MSFKEERAKNFSTHKWSSYPGSFCSRCFIHNPLETAVVLGTDDTDEWYCPPCLTGKVKAVFQEIRLDE